MEARVGLPAASRLGGTLRAPRPARGWQPAALLAYPHLCVVVDAARTVAAAGAAAGALEGARLLAGPPGAGEPDALAWAPDASLFALAFGQTLQIFAAAAKDHHNDNDDDDGDDEDEEDGDEARDGGLRLGWPAQSRMLVMRQHIRDVACSARLADGHLGWIALAGSHGVKIIDAEQRAKPVYLVQSFSVNVVAFHEHTLLVGTTDGHLGVWELPRSLRDAQMAGASVLDASWRTLVNGLGRFTDASFSSDGAHFAVASWRDGVYVFSRGRRRDKGIDFVLQRQLSSAGPHKTLQHGSLVCFAPPMSDPSLAAAASSLLAYTTQESQSVKFHLVDADQDVDAWTDLGDVVTGMASTGDALVVHTAQGSLLARIWPVELCRAQGGPRLPALGDLPEAVASDLREQRLVQHVVAEGVRVILVEGCAHVCFIESNTWRAIVTRATALIALAGPTFVFAGPAWKARGVLVDVTTCSLIPTASVETIAVNAAGADAELTTAFSNGSPSTSTAIMAAAADLKVAGGPARSAGSIPRSMIELTPSSALARDAAGRDLFEVHVKISNAPDRGPNVKA